MSLKIAENQSGAVDPCQVLHISLNPDGSITRHDDNWPKTPATPDPPNDIPVLSKDVFINQSTNVWVRIFLPRQALLDHNKLPLIVYFHGGGFIICSADMTAFHNFCLNMAVQVQAVVLSVKYRLAPEHRLPTAYDDAIEVLHWIKTTTEEWLTKYVDFSNCFLMGNSAGGNLAYHAGLRAAAEVDNLQPLKIRGLILHHPFFGGTNKTDSELRLADKNPLYHRSVVELAWNLCLPIGAEADLDHEYCNPAVEGGSKVVLDQIKRLGWKVMMSGCYGDPVIDRLIELVKIMEEKGVQVVSHFVEGGSHSMEIGDASKAMVLYSQIKDFIFSS
ncbi:hypothetical protein QYF36_010711 [Acer negundo]|nr:hypothetical protein QYF36_010711 [Acer negundo]